MLGERLRVRLCTELVQQSCRALDVGKEQRHGPGRQFGHPGTIPLARTHDNAGSCAGTVATSLPGELDRLVQGVTTSRLTRRATLSGVGTRIVTERCPHTW
jgi:hypothetical protein